MKISKYHVQVFKKLSRLTKANRKKHLSLWPHKAYKDIKKICGDLCHSKKIKPSVLKKISPQKKILRLVAKNPPAKVKKILLDQKGNGIFKAINTGLPALILVTQKT